MKKKNKDLILEPSNGTASDVAGMISATSIKNTVRDSRIVTPETEGCRFW